jgi:putative Mn2+ efflux pump MntP
MNKPPPTSSLVFGGILGIFGVLIAIRGWGYSKAAAGAIHEGIHVRVYGIILIFAGAALVIDFFRRKRNKLKE